jgi:hypothetical protein
MYPQDWETLCNQTRQIESFRWHGRAPTNLDDMQRRLATVLAKGLPLRGSILGLPMGLGKTRTAIAAGMEYLRRTQPHAPWLAVMASRNLFAQWTRELELVYPGTQVFAYRDVRDLPALQALQHSHAACEVVVLMTHHAVHASLHQLPRPGTRGGLPIGLVVIDEVHLMVNTECAHVQSVCTWLPMRKLGITGTPFHSGLPADELRHYQQLVDPIRGTHPDGPLAYHLLWIQSVPMVPLPVIHREYSFVAPTAEERSGYDVLLQKMRRSYELWQKVRKQRGSLHPDTKTMYQAYVH